MDKLKIINEIKGFLEGYNEDLKYLVNVEANPNNSYAECVVHPPKGQKEILKVDYISFTYTKDFGRNNVRLYRGDEKLMQEKMIQYGVRVEKMKTGNQERLENGYCWKYSSYKSYNSLVYFFRDGGIYPYEKLLDENDVIVKDKKGRPIYKYLSLFFSPKPAEQFLIDKRARLYKGYEEYKDVHKLVFDIETTGLRHEISRVFAIGVKDNRGFEIALKVDKINDDEAEARLIQDMFNLINHIKPAIIYGHNSEHFDFHYILGRANILKMNLDNIPTSLKKDVKIRRIPNSTVKIGDSSEKYTSTQMWGYSIIDTYHAAKKISKLDSDMKGSGLKYVCKYEGIAKPDRTYIPGEDNDIARYFHENPMFVSNDDNVHLEIPNEFKETAINLTKLQNNKHKLNDNQYKEFKNKCLKSDPQFVVWFRKEALPQKMTKFITGKKLLNQYLLDDLWETEQVDELYNQSSFMMAKIVPTTYNRICTMGTASVWNLLLTAWSFEKGLAIPESDVKKNFSGGLSRCYKKGYIENLVKIDYASLYPMIQLTRDIFPIFDISNVMNKMLIYMTTSRNIYKKLGRGTPLNAEELGLVEGMDHDTHHKYVTDTLSKDDRNMFKIKEKPIKILNNSQFGALGSDVSFNWSDNECAARITCCGRIELRHAINWFEIFKCVPLYAVTDGVNFQIPKTTNIKVTKDGILYDQPEDTVENMWDYDGRNGINALIEYFNDHEMVKPFMSVDNDGEFISCFNLARINYAVLQAGKDKETGEVKNKIKLTGNTIKSSVLSEYIEEFMNNGWKLILDGKGSEFVEYYNDYAQKIFYKQIPLKKIASKSKYKHTIKQYNNRGTDVNGRLKAKKAHMELIIRTREGIAEDLFQQHKGSLELKKSEEKMTIADKMKFIEVYMPPEPDLDSTMYYYNTGYRKSHADSKEIKDNVTGDLRFAATLISKQQIQDNPEMTGDYNVDKYLEAFNKRVKSLFYAFDPEIAERIPANIVRKKVLDSHGKKKETEDIVINQFTSTQLELKSFDLDSVDESMYLEEKEVEFWNEYGYDPRLIWDGFKMRDDMKVHYEIYDDALNFLNAKMEKMGKPLIKSRNSKHGKGDLILIKNAAVYSVGLNNGEYIEIVRSDVKIPKSAIELELDEKLQKQEEEIKNLNVGVDLKSELEKEVKLTILKRREVFVNFKSKFNLPDDVDFDKFIADAGEQGNELIDSFIDTENSKTDNQNAEYMGYD